MAEQHQPLAGKVAVVTGASRGVGRGVALGLGEAGATVYITGRSESHEQPPAERTIQETAASVTALGGIGIPVALDHNDDAAVEALFKRVTSEPGPRAALAAQNCRCIRQ